MQSTSLRRALRAAWFLAALSVTLTLTAATPPPARPLAPYADYHQHLFSPEKARVVFELPLPAIDLPAELAALVRRREQAWNDSAALASVFSEDAVLLNTQDEDFTSWMRGRGAVSLELTRYFQSAYRITPVAYALEGAAGHVAGYYTRGEGEKLRHFGHVLLVVQRGAGGAWRIAAETPAFPGPPTRAPIVADQVVAQLDEAGIRKAVVLSTAYQWGSPFAPQGGDEVARVRAENDFVAREAAKHPSRLVPFGSFNPLRDYALAELERCATTLRMPGIKLHLGNSRVDLRKPEHAAKVRAVFQAANARKRAIVIHLWTDPAYEEEGGQHARAFLEHVLPAAPDVPIQIAHMAGGGRSTDSALAVFAGAIQRGDRRTRNLWFDTATMTAGRSAAGLQQDAMRMRQIGMNRILYGTDASPPNPAARISWGNFRALMPLTDAELRTIAGNVAPYVR